MCNCGGCYGCLIEQGKVPDKCPQCKKEYNNIQPKHYPFCSLECEDAAQVAFHSEVTENANEQMNERV